MKAIASAPGKIILTGEHFVVYDEPAIVMAINLGIHVTVEERSDYNIYTSSNLGFSGTFIDEKFKPENGGLAAEEILKPIKIAVRTAFNALHKKLGVNVFVNSGLPIAAGLGSSGALAVAAIASIGKLLGTDFSKEEIVKLAFESEKYVHSHPSGIDQTISAYGGIIVYNRSDGISHLDIGPAIPIVIGNTGIRRNTGVLVDNVKARKEIFPNIMTPLIHSAGQLTKQAIDALKKGNLNQLGELMDINHGLLMAIGVSIEALDRLVNAAKKAGALGAKLTGAGGGGCMIALSTLEKRQSIADAIRLVDGTPIIAEKTDLGVRTWLIS